MGLLLGNPADELIHETGPVMDYYNSTIDRCTKLFISEWCSIVTGIESIIKSAHDLLKNIKIVHL